jgi:hypothetical protein
MKRRLFSLITVLISIVMALGAIEGMAIVWLYLEEGRYVSAEEMFRRIDNAYVHDFTKGTTCRYVDTLFPHPYLAFVHHANPPCGFANLNNIGLIGVDFPTEKQADRYTILLGGGSIASQLAQIEPPPAPRYLEEELNRNYESPNGKPFLVLNGGDGAWKQPQPFILFMLFASSVDAVITIGGSNEYYMFRNYVRERLERPVNNFVDVNPMASDENFGDAAIGWVMGRFANMLALNPVLGHSHATYMIVRSIEALAKGRGFVKSDKRTTLDSIFALPPDILGDGEKIFAYQLALYKKYQSALEAVAHDNGVKAAYFFHAVPAYRKTLTAAEKAVVGDLSYGPLYRRMVESMLAQRSSGMAVFDLGDLLVDVKETVYVDDAHFYRSPNGESLGYRLMARAIAEDVAQAWGLRRKNK